MKFFSFASVALAAFTGLVSAIDSATVITNIQAVADLSAQTNTMVSSITVVNVVVVGPVSACNRVWHHYLLTLAQQVAQSINKIVNVVNTDIQAMLVSASLHRSF
jgi:hypothetical protein